jgi:hypothetical protein
VGKECFRDETTAWTKEVQQHSPWTSKNNFEKRPRSVNIQLEAGCNMAYFKRTVFFAAI